MLKLYAVPISLYCAKVRIVLHHKGVTWEEISPPGGYGSDEYKSVVPAGNLPALDHDGLILGDSEAISEYLNEAFPEPPMLPDEVKQRAKIRECSRFHDTRLEPALRALFPDIGAVDLDRTKLDEKWKALLIRLRQAEPLLSARGVKLTLADCGFPITCCWIECLAHHFGKPNPISPLIGDYLERIGKHDAVSNELADYRPKLLDWLATK